MHFQQTNVSLVSQTAVSHLNMEFFSIHLTTNSLVQPPDHISHVMGKVAGFKIAASGIFLVTTELPKFKIVFRKAQSHVQSFFFF